MCATASPRGTVKQIKRERVTDGGSDLEITASEFETGFAELVAAGLITVDPATITVSAQLYKAICNIDADDPEQDLREYGIIRDYCYGEIAGLRRPRPQIWCEEIDGESVAFEFTRHNATCWHIRAMASSFSRACTLTISPYDDIYEGTGLLEVIALMTSQVRAKVRRKLKRNSKKCD